MTIKDKKNEKKVIDGVLHGLIHDGKLRCAVAIVTDTIKTAQEKHNLDPVATMALGRTFACTALLGSRLKESGHSLHCQIDGNGPMKHIVSQYVYPSALRGYVAVPQMISVIEDEKDIPQSVPEAIGNLGLVTIKTTQKENQPYTGISTLVSGEIAEDIAHYLDESEQIPSIVGAGVKLSPEGKILSAGGILIQKIAGVEVEDSVLEELEALVSNEFNITQKIIDGETLEDIFYDFTHVDPKKVELEFKPLGFYCYCSRDRTAINLRNLGNEEIEKTFEEVGKIETRCHYCSTVYNFTKEELMMH